MEADSWSEEEKVPVSQADSLPGCSDGPSTKAMRLDKKLSEEMSSTAQYQATDFQTSDKDNIRRKNLGLTYHEYEPPPLPVDWVAINHCSGGIVYFHKPTRVCTWCRPYHVSSSVTIKKHRVPVQAIPCLEKWLFQEERCQLADQWHHTAGERKGPLIKLEPHNLREYLSQRWEIVEEGDEESVLDDERYKKTLPEAQQKKEEHKSLVPHDLSKVLHIPIPKEYRQHHESEAKKPPAVWTVNISNTSAVSLLFHFCQSYLKTSPEFLIEETNNRMTPFSCTIAIGSMKYGHKMASTKRKAKHSAAEETLDLFLPGAFEKEQQSTLEKEFQYLSSIEIGDPQAAQLLQQVGMPTPWHVLKECRRRNQDTPGFSGELQFTLSSKDKCSFEYCLSLEHHTVKGLCVGKKDGQQMAAQAMLKELHPFITNWGALLRIYDDRHSTNFESQDLRDRSSCSGTDADHSILKQLKEEMQKLAKDQSLSTADDCGLLQM